MNEINCLSLEDLNQDQMLHLMGLIKILKIFEKGLEKTDFPSKFFFPNNNCEIIRSYLFNNYIKELNFDKDTRIKNEKTNKSIFTVVGSEGCILYGMFRYLDCQTSKFTDGKYHFYKIISPRNVEFINNYTSQFKE